MRSRWALVVFSFLAVFLSSGCPKNNTDVEPLVVPVWPDPPQSPVIRYEEVIIGSPWVKRPTRFRRFWAVLTNSSVATYFRLPSSVAVDQTGRVFVGDRGWGRVMVLDPNTDKQTWLASDGSVNIRRPMGLDVDSRGHLFVADTQSRRVWEFDAELEYVNAYGDSKKLTTPTSVVVVEGRGEIWVLDTTGHRIQIFEIGGGHLRTIGERGGGPGQFNYPSAIAASSDGEIFITDSMNFRIQVLDVDGNFLRVFGENCDGPGCLARAKGIAVDSDNNVHVVDAAFGRVQMFNSTGELLLWYGKGGSGPGGLVLPTRIAIDHEDKIYIVASTQGRISIFEYLGAPLEEGEEGLDDDEALDEEGGGAPADNEDILPDEVDPPELVGEGEPTDLEPVVDPEP